ncbi:MAG: hypothetical protein ACRDL0_04670 [Thermoleophilaceae bacterium]
MRRESTSIAAGRARRVQMLHANRHSERWEELAPLPARVEPPRRDERDGRVPGRLRHLFWNSAPSVRSSLRSQVASLLSKAEDEREQT